MDVPFKNNTVYCDDPTNISSGGMWHGTNPLLSTVPLLLVQLTLFSLTSRVVEILLKPLGQCSIVAQILGGLLLGPSVLGLAPKIAEELFPPRGNVMIETLATFGLTSFIFSMGVKMDSSLIFKPGRTALLIAISLFIFTLVVPLAICFTLMKNLHMEMQLAMSLPLIVGSQSLVAFPAIACLLAELKIFNTEVGRLAVATTMFYDLLAMGTCALSFSYFQTMGGGIGKSLLAVGCTLGLCIGIVIIVRFIVLPLLPDDQISSPISSSMLPKGTSTNDLHLTVIFLLILITALLSEIVGQHYFLGPSILGLAVPDESPLGGVLVSKFDTFVSGLLYPTFLAITGLKTDIFTVGITRTWITAVVVLTGVIAKFAAVMLPARYCNISSQNAFVLSLVLNARGINELIMYNLVLQDKQISNEQFTLSVISVLLVTAIITPLIKIFYGPSRRYIPMKRMTILHHKKDTEIRIVVCIHQQDNIPTILNLLEATSPSTESPVRAIVVALVEVVGSSAPMLVGYRPHKTQEQGNSSNSHISNAFQQFERQNDGNASVQVYTNMSHFDAMHDDVCRVTADERANLLILPFHKQWAIDGTVGAVNRAIQAMNQKLIESAPCSLGILVDRGPLSGSLCILNSRSTTYHVAVLFIGGADDVESLAYGARMVKHERVVVTVIRFLLLGRDNSRDRKHGTETIEEYKRANLGNDRFKYREELVKDGLGLAESVRGMEKTFHLIIVGKDHQNSPLLFGLHEWSECPELGVIGDLLASPDTQTTSSVLIIQQQKLAAKTNVHVSTVQNDRDTFIHDDQEKTGGQRNSHTSSVSISMST